MVKTIEEKTLDSIVKFLIPGEGMDSQTYRAYVDKLFNYEYNKE